MCILYPHRLHILVTRPPFPPSPLPLLRLHFVCFLIPQIYSHPQLDPLYEKRTRTFGLGGALPPRKDVRRFVKWPKYVRLQRQRRILLQRLKCPPALNQFTKTLDKNAAQTVLSLFMKYRPEDKAAKKERLQKEAETKVRNLCTCYRTPTI